MAKDKSADKRLEYNQQISAKEREIDDLKAEEQQAKASLESFEETMMNSFRNIQEIEEDINRRSGNAGAFSETEQKQRYIRQLVSDQKEEMTAQYQKAAQDLEEEREKLQRERDELPWD